MSLCCTGTMHTFLYCVLLPFVGPVLNSVGAPKLDMTSFLTNDSGLGFASSNREKIPVIPSVRYLGAISMQSGFQLLLGFALVNSFGAPKLATTAFFSYESGLGFFPPNLKRIPIKSSPRYLGAISMQSRCNLDSNWFSALRSFNQLPQHALIALAIFLHAHSARPLVRPAQRMWCHGRMQQSSQDQLQVL